MHLLLLHSGHAGYAANGGVIGMDELRSVLRQGTRTAHERLEHCFSTLDLTGHANYAAFLRAQGQDVVTTREPRRGSELSLGIAFHAAPKK